jgi:hypothetical protein
MRYFLGFIVIVVVVTIANTQKEKSIRELKCRYDDLLKGSNKRAALEAGRAYYSALRKNKALTSMMSRLLLTIWLQ